ncbi:MAG: 2-oxoacid:acceptor oxidoreductase family protein [Clostridia bacterium]|nr:2-oxoacid:acceptor oxidoreductase family protein [Clostridia bacterium]
MPNRTEIRLAGSGGQGVILGSIILAEAAILAGKNVAQTQSYGPEARGGLCKADVVMCDGPVGFFKVSKPNLLLTLTQTSLDRYAAGICNDGTVIIDDSLTPPETLKTSGLIRIPIIKTARETLGKAFTINIIALGAINKLLSLVSHEQMRTAVGMHIPKGTEEINFKALKAGEELLR